MNKVIIALLSLFIGLSSFAQETELEAKKKELAALQADVKAKTAAIDKIKAEIVALKPPVYWKKGGFTSLNFNTVGLNNWAAGGVQANSVTALADFFANYKKDKIEWSNQLDLAYGLIQNEGETFRKNEDKIDYLSKYGYHATKRLSYAILANFKSQFQPGYDFGNPDPERPVISRFLAPAFINLSIGLDYKLTPWLSIYFSPAAGKFTIVADDSIAAQNIYIPSSEDAQGVQFYKDNFRAEFGAFFQAMATKELGKNVKLKSRLDLFNNFTDKNVSNRENIDVNWETTVNFKLTKFIGASLFTHLIYDNDVDLPTEFDANDVAIAYGPRLQFKRVFGVGFSYKF